MISAMQTPMIATTIAGCRREGGGALMLGNYLRQRGADGESSLRGMGRMEHDLICPIGRISSIACTAARARGGYLRMGSTAAAVIRRRNDLVGIVGEVGGEPFFHGGKI